MFWCKPFQFCLITADNNLWFNQRSALLHWSEKLLIIYKVMALYAFRIYRNKPGLLFSVESAHTNKVTFVSTKAALRMNKWPLQTFLLADWKVFQHFILSLFSQGGLKISRWKHVAFTGIFKDCQIGSEISGVRFVVTLRAEFK